MDNIALKIEQIKKQIAAAALRSALPNREITLVAVTKSASVDQIREALCCGIRHAGENRVQEAARKIPILAQGDGSAGICWHMIGHVQSNKINKISELFTRVDSIDREEIVFLLDERLRVLQKRMDVLVEVKLSGESAKSGVDKEKMFSLVDALGRLEYCRLKGLMTMAPWTEEEEARRAVFRKLAELFDQVNSRGVGQRRLEVLSMGMSDDFEIAVEEGATEVRIGRAIFGGLS